MPATFFIVGENALTERGLLQRMIREGHEVGSHTYTHPNLATVGKTQTLFELNATQRLFQAFTGRTLKLFRAPFFGDAEPTTADEILPVVGCAEPRLYFGRPARRQRGLAAAGRSGDRQQRAVADRHRRRPPATITSESQCSRNIVLLHDSGGDRSQTVAALPDPHRYAARPRLPVRCRVGACRAFAEPGDAAAVAGRIISRRGSTSASSSCSAFLIRALGFLFAAAITLGIGRALVLTGLALAVSVEGTRIARGRPIDPETFVSVLIPAFNEERVIERSVSAGARERRTCASKSSSSTTARRTATSEIVERAFGGRSARAAAEAREWRQGAGAQPGPRACARARS